MSVVHATSPIPRTEEQLYSAVGAEFLTSSMRQLGVLPASVRVVKVEASKARPEGWEGQALGTKRIVITYEPAAHPGPRTAIIKATPALPACQNLGA